MSFAVLEKSKEERKTILHKRKKMPKNQSLNKLGRTSRMVTRSYARTTSPACPHGSVEAAELSPEPSQHESGTDPAVWTGAIRENVLNQPVQAGPAAPQATHRSPSLAGRACAGNVDSRVLGASQKVSCTRGAWGNESLLDTCIQGFAGRPDEGQS